MNEKLTSTTDIYCKQRFATSFILNNSCKGVYFNVHFLQGGAGTKLRWGGIFCFSFSTVDLLNKNRFISAKVIVKISGTFLWATVYTVGHNKVKLVSLPQLCICRLSLIILSLLHIEMSCGIMKLNLPPCRKLLATLPCEIWAFNNTTA